jgi:cell division protein FtsQ
MAALDTTGEKISSKLSEVDVSDPEDIRAVVPDAGGSDVLVHFGDERFLARYHAYRQHLAEWRAQYPRLASVDMRYEQQVVLGMKPDAPASIAPASSPAAALSTASAPAASTPTAPPTAHADPPPPSAALNSIAKTHAPATKPSISKPTAHVVAHRAAAKSLPLHRPKRAKAQPKKITASHAKAKPSSSPTHAVSEVAR